ncbi:MAG: NAD(P)/FAD-dependent oxidoreductase [Tissierellia bacterium]|nr:NAD(P)/FAD-dependent oxidoreductase [Tissierellia bacterium]
MKIGIIGAGASGLMAAYSASENDNEVFLFEKNEKIGKKLYITGKGRCNITNMKPIEELLDHVVTNKNFLYSAFYTFTNHDLVRFLESNGLKVKVERGERVFPESDKSSDVITTFGKVLSKRKVKIYLNENVLKISKTDNRFLISTVNNNYYVDKLIVATGGMSYQATGSTGDGYAFAQGFGHKITEIIPSLVPIIHNNPELETLQGVTLENIELKVKTQGKTYVEFGDLMFTKNGITGPTVLRISSKINKLRSEDLRISIDLKPSLSFEKLDSRILRDFKNNQNKSVINAIEKISTKSLIPIILSRAEVNKDTKVNQLKKEDRLNIVNSIKNFYLSFNSLDDINHAIITSGGISVKEINSSTMESKVVKNLYFAGEIIDVDALTGGYNLQIAFSTGYLAGLSASKEEI